MFSFFEKKDSQLQKDVLNELKWDPSLRSEQINVTAKDGIVTLRGTVPHYFEKSTAEEAAQRVGGVRAVADEMEVDLLADYERSDEEIAKAALSAIAWDYSAPKNMKVTVEKGWITLKGQTEWEYQRIAAKNCVSSLLGVRGVSNQVTIKPRAYASDVKTKIQDALKRAAANEGRNISVSVSGNTVTLSGNVHTFSEIADAGLAAWSAPGVILVENNLKLAH